MSWDIYGNPLRRGHCEVHPHVHEEYPCSVCIAERKYNQQHSLECHPDYELERLDYELDQQNEYIKRLQELLVKYGICEDCGELYNHHIDAPLASCGCKQSEWYELTPHMKQVLELKTERDALAAQVERLQYYITKYQELGAEFILTEAITKTPRQCLRDVQAEAGVKGLRRGVALASGGDISLDSILVKIWSDGYAESVRQGDGK